MEDFAGLIVFFLILGVIDKFGKKKKNRKNPKQPGPRTPERAAPQRAAAPAQEVALPVQAVKKAVKHTDAYELLKIIEAARQEKAKSAPSEEKEKTSIEQAVGLRKSGISDSEGCIGGSIAHTQHEGESHAVHTEHMKRMVRPAAQTAQPAVSIRKLRTEDLRKAVVMSEILAKPKALRH